MGREVRDLYTEAGLEYGDDALAVAFGDLTYLSAVLPGIQATVVAVKTKDGVWTDRVDFPKGEPENPLTDKEFRDRYDGLMEYAGVDTAISSAVFDTVYREKAKVEDNAFKEENGIDMVDEEEKPKKKKHGKR